MSELPPLWPYHALLVTTGFVVMLGGMLTARYMKRKSWWLKAHKTLGISGALLIISGVIVAVYMVLTHSDTYLVEEPHAVWKMTCNSEGRTGNYHCISDFRILFHQEQTASFCILASSSRDSSAHNLLFIFLRHVLEHGAHEIDTTHLP